MAICGKCGAESTRIRTIFEIDGQRLPEPKDECPQCAPLSFDRFETPSEQKIWMSWEKEPQHYRREYDKDGLIMMPTDSVLQDLQDAVLKEPGEVLQASEKAIEEKRATRRTSPLTEEEMALAVTRARGIAFDIEAALRQADYQRRLMEEASNTSVN